MACIKIMSRFLFCHHLDKTSFLVQQKPNHELSGQRSWGWGQSYKATDKKVEESPLLIS